MATVNCYEDAERARAYAKLEFSGTYYLAYRDLPGILSLHAKGKKRWILAVARDVPRGS